MKVKAEAMEPVIWFSGFDSMLISDKPQRHIKKVKNEDSIPMKLEILLCQLSANSIEVNMALKGD